MLGKINPDALLRAVGGDAEVWGRANIQCAWPLPADRDAGRPAFLPSI